MIHNIYSWFHRVVTRREEKDQPSGGVWPHAIRTKVLTMCKGCTGKLLEIGCGEGLFLVQIARDNQDVSCVGIDTNNEKLNCAKESAKRKNLHNITFLHTEAGSLPLEACDYDMVVCINVFLNVESIKVVEDIVSEASRLLKAGGRFLFDFRNSLNPLLNLKYKLAPLYDRTIKETKLPLNTYQPRIIEQLLGKYNFTIINRHYLGFPYTVLAPIVIVEAEKC